MSDMYFRLEPEVAGGLAPGTVQDRSIHPPIVSKLHYQFDGWLGDDLLESFPCYIATLRLIEALKTNNLTGFHIAEVAVSRTPEFDELQPDYKLPEFKWLQVTGKAGSADLGLAAPARLVVSQRAMEVLKRFNLAYCDIAEYRPA